MQTTLTIDQIVNEFLSEQDVSESSRLTYKSILSGFFHWLTVQKKDKRTVAKSDILEWKSYLLKNRAITYSCTSLSVIKKFYSWLETKNYHSNSAKDIHLPKRYTGFRKEPFAFHDILSMTNNIDRSTFKGYRDYVMLNLMFRRGLRLIEVSRMNIEDIQNFNHEIIIRIQRKGQKEKSDFIVVTGFLYDLIEKYLTEFRASALPSDPLFISRSRYNIDERITSRGIGKIISGYLQSSGLKDKTHTPHSLRHTVAVHLLTSGFDIYKVQKLLGHSKTEITELYTRVAEHQVKISNETGRFLDEIC